MPGGHTLTPQKFVDFVGTSRTRDRHEKLLEEIVVVQIILPHFILSNHGFKCAGSTSLHSGCKPPAFQLLPSSPHPVHSVQTIKFCTPRCILHLSPDGELAVFCPETT